MSVERSSESLHVGPLRIGEWHVEPALDQLSRKGEIVKLEPRTTRVLLRLAASAGQVVSSQQLLDDIWPGVVVGPASVYQAISQLRKVLADTEPSPAYIATVPRKGYRLVAPVHHLDRNHVPRVRIERRAGMRLHRWLAATVLCSVSATAFALWLQDGEQSLATPSGDSSCNRADASGAKRDAVDISVLHGPRSVERRGGSIEHIVSVRRVRA